MASGSDRATATATAAANANANANAKLSSASDAPRVLYRTVVFRHPAVDPYDRANLHGFNHGPSIALLSDGRLLAAWFSGPYEAAINQVILGAYSSDDGRTWGEAQTLQNTPRLSDFDPAFISDAGRTWLFSSKGRHNRYPAVRDRSTGIGPASFTTQARHTDDGGRTWSEPAPIWPRVFCRSNGIRLSSGELLLPVYESPANTAGVLISSDRGRTWRHVGGVVGQAGAGEPTITETSTGDVLMFLRTRDGFIWQTRSPDRGATWTPPAKTTLAAPTTSHHLLRLRDGRLALTHNDTTSGIRTNLTLRLSADDGATWGTPVKLADAEPIDPGVEWMHCEVSYPSVVETAGGALLAVWTAISMSELAQYGDIHVAAVQVPPHSGN